VHETKQTYKRIGKQKMNKSNILRLFFVKVLIIIIIIHSLAVWDFPSGIYAYFMISAFKPSISIIF